MDELHDYKKKEVKKMLKLLSAASVVHGVSIFVSKIDSSVNIDLTKKAIEKSIDDLSGIK